MIMQRTGSHFLCMVIFLYLFRKLTISCILKDIIIKKLYVFPWMSKKWSILKFYIQRSRMISGERNYE